ncbi:MAG: class I SAM-dependent methyltransferase [Acidobacteriota bacterium]|jgi:SAM-dependent methyltransferase|nr:class I SAM-dependent methyltransferase [Acidobacteriota bacterium]
MNVASLDLKDWSSLPTPQRCPVCDAAESFPVVCPVVLATAEPVYALVECPHCHVRFLHPSPDDEALRRFYAPHYFGADWYSQEEKGRMFAQRMLPGVFGERFLDVGCNLGYFLYGVAHTSSWEAHGVEISREAAAYAREKLLLDVHGGELADAGYPDEFFGFVRVNNVLEHVRKPGEFLKECRRILRKDGQLYLSVPNGPVDSAGLLDYFQSERTPPRSKDGHLFFFSEHALQRLFRNAKFKVATAHTYGIRRGLRALGRYPRKLRWKAPYRLPDAAPEKEEIVLAPRPRRLPGYAAFRYWQSRLKRIPGLASYGLDYEILLTAV